MSTEPITSAAATLQDPQPNYEYLQVQATVINFTDKTMEITGSDLSWGKWIKSPVNVSSYDSSPFASQGRDSSPSGTEGWASWKLGDAEIRVTFSCPMIGSNTQTISCTPSGRYKVTTTGTGGNVNQVSFTIKPA